MPVRVATKRSVIALWNESSVTEQSKMTQPLRLSIFQKRIWVLDQVYPQNPAQNLSCGLRLNGSFDGRTWEIALAEIVEQHEILRTEFHSIDGAPVQVVLSPPAINVAAIDLTHFPPQEREAQLFRLAEEAARLPFDLNHGPLLRATLFQLSETEHSVLLVVHRIACDEASLRLLLRELLLRYEARINGRSPQESKIQQYREIATARETVAEAELSYWKEQLAGAPSSVDLPTDRPRPALPTFRGVKQKIEIGAPLLEQLQGLSRSKGVTLFSTLLAAFYVLLFRHSRQEDIVVGTSVSGRGRCEFEKLIGPLENMLALRAEILGEATFADLLDRVDKIAQGAFSHGDVPFEVLVKKLHLERDISRHPLFQIMFIMHDVAEEPEFPQGVSLFEVESETEQFDLSVKLALNEFALEATFSYDPDLFDASTIERMGSHFRILLEAAAKDPGCNVSLMPLLAEGERHQLLVEWNDTEVEYSTDVPLHKFIEEQVQKSPDSVAVMYMSEQLTYRQLNNRANQLANYLKKLKVGPDVLVAVFMERSLELVTSLLAILKAGGAYVPLDPEYPKDRLETMLRDAAPPVLLTQAHLLDRVPDNGRRNFCVDRDWSSLAAGSTENLPVAVGGKNLAYAIYTSGSTGKPKGVLNVHEGIVNRLLWMQDMYRLTGRDRVLQKTPFSFDVSVWEFFWPLMTGATLVIARPGGHRDPAYLVNLIAETEITTLHFVPSMLSIFLEAEGLERCHSLRRVFASGEALPFELQQRFFERVGAELHNLYGPTEAAVDVTYWVCRADSEQAIVPIGRPIANTQIYILDANLQPAPIGVAGELHIGGIGLARGYLNRPDLTAQKFIPNPFSETQDARLYKTGDLARFLNDGNIEYLGRIDHQVKLRGFRIELGEIEAVLGECPEVRQAIVTVREDNPGDKRLVAYLIAAPNRDLDIDRLRREVGKKLPEHMVPSRFVVVESLPMTTSGKVDRKALPAPPVERGSLGVAVAPRSELESQIASAFARTLGLDSVGVTDNFFDLGGHSLTAARLLTQVKGITGRQILLSALFRGATVESLVRLIHEQEDASDPVIMEIQRGDGSRLPFFAIVPPGEESLGYAILARHMGPGQRVYKVQGHAPIVGKRPYTEQEMQSLAVEYVMAMRGVQPNGPYCLGGLCDGAHIGERVILELEAQGQEVALFAVIDTWVLQNSQRQWLWRVDYFQRRLREATNRSLAEQFQLYKQAASNRMQRLMGKIPARTDWQDTYWPRQYIPISYSAPVVLFKRPKQPYHYVKDPQMGWGARTKSGVEIHEIDFDHDYLLREPHVRVLGEKLAASVKRATGERKPAAQHDKSLAPGQPVISAEDPGV
jgi:amino acid adenylation domain-containing protein